MKFTAIILALLILTIHLKSQRLDTTKPKVITIAGAFKPVLKSFEKINFLPQPFAIDSSKPNLKYNVPVQNLFFVYTPVPLKPLALQINPISTLQNGAYVKAGYGNFNSPFLQAGASIGDGKYSIFNAYAGYQGVKGKQYLQKATNAYIGLNGTIVTNKNLEAFAGLQFNINNSNRFGFNNAIYNYTQDFVKHNVNTLATLFSVKNANPTEWGINYNPSVAINYASNNYKNNELRAIISIPLEKRFGQYLTFNVKGVADIATAKTKTFNSKANNLFYVLPEFTFKYKSVLVQAGVLPAWDNKTFYFSPNIIAQARFGQNKFLFTAGWITNYQKGSLQNWWNQNSFINDTIALFNTRNQEIFGGLKGTSGNHLTYNAKVSFSTIQNMPLFTNNSFDAKTFYVLNELSMQRLQLHGNIAYTVNERFNFEASANINQFLNLKTFSKAYGLLPIEANAKLNWNLTKAININAGLLFFDGARFLLANNTITKNKAAADVNLGFDVNITKQFKIWLQGSNLLNTNYTRWNNYNAVGFQLQGGLIFNTNFKKNKVQ
jgi:hypothetical protein